MSEAHDKHIAVLDGLRAMAILLVMVGHAAGNQWVDRSKPFFPIGPFDLGGTLLNCGWGVELFFVLSGFLITGQLLDVFLGDRERYRSGLRRYFKRRFFRIAPAYYVVLTFVTLVFMSLSPAQQVYNWVWSYVAAQFLLYPLLAGFLVPCDRDAVLLRGAAFPFCAFAHHLPVQALRRRGRSCCCPRFSSNHGRFAQAVFFA
jgi:peptidoglycan/LPS O-acetylase OafA/YrhL